MTWNGICLSRVETDTHLPIYRHPDPTTAPNTLSSSLIFPLASRTITWTFLS